MFGEYGKQQLHLAANLQYWKLPTYVSVQKSVHISTRNIQTLIWGMCIGIALHSRSFGDWLTMQWLCKACFSLPHSAWSLHSIHSQGSDINFVMLRLTYFKRVEQILQ